MKRKKSKLVAGFESLLSSVALSTTEKNLKKAITCSRHSYSRAREKNSRRKKEQLLRLIPPFVLLKVKWFPQKNPPPPLPVINNDRGPLTRGTLGGTQYRNTVRKIGKYRNTVLKVVEKYRYRNYDRSRLFKVVTISRVCLSQACMHHQSTSAIAKKRGEELKLIGTTI